MATKTIADINVKGKRVLMRVDFNVPLEGGRITDDRRIEAALPSIRKVIEDGGKLILMSHLGRPDGEIDHEYSLGPCAERLGKLLSQPVQIGPDTVVDDAVRDMVHRMVAGDVLLLENLRFHPGETMPDKAKKNPDKKLTAGQQEVLDAFAQALGDLGDVYVNDAFGTCHRKHASMYGAARVIQKKGGPAVAGFLVEKEIRYLHDAVDDPKRPFVAILGGAKVSDKIGVISTLLQKVDRILIGGAMAYTLLKARGVSVGMSRVEEDQVARMSDLLTEAGDKIVLPVDHVCAEAFDSDDARRVDTQEITPELMGLDIGDKTVAAFSEIIAGAKTVVWNGPMGVFEREAYAEGTRKVAIAVAEATDAGAVSIIGGGDSAAAVEQMNLADRMSHVSTGGGASLTYLEGKPMPAIEVLDPA